MPETTEDIFDYSFVNSIARVALYDDMKSAPRITRIEPSPTNDFIEHLTTAIYEQSKLAGGKIPYSVIREVSENFIHAQFKEIVVSILDDGNTIRFADQGPGIAEKEKAQKPGFSSAIEPMKNYIRGVGSGFPIVRDYLDDRNGSIVIEDNLTAGAVVTISMKDKASSHVKHQPQFPQSQQVFLPPIPLSEREKVFLKLLFHEEELGITELNQLTETPFSTIHSTLRKLEENGLVEKLPNKKRYLTQIGIQVAQNLE